MSLFLVSTSQGADGPRDTLWKEFRQHMDGGLPQSAVAALARILPGALGDKAWGEAAKAMAYRAMLEGQRTEPEGGGRIRLLQNELEALAPQIGRLREFALGRETEALSATASLAGVGDALAASAASVRLWTASESWAKSAGRMSER